MTKNKKKFFESVEEIFETYIPGYVPPDLREPREVESTQEIALSTEFTSSLLKQFKEDIGPAEKAD